MGKFTFSKAEKLSKEIWIKELFNRGSSFNLYPFRIILLPNPSVDFPVHQILISVSVRNFKKAVERNLIKRRIREAWRLNKHQMVIPSKLLIAYIYTARKIEDYKKIESGVIRGMEGISQRFPLPESST